MEPKEAPMPALYVGHGSPMNCIQDNAFTRDLRAWGQRLPRPKAVLVVSAHWLTRGTSVTCMGEPEQIYDFYGFPEALYQVTYACPGAPEQAELTRRLVRRTEVQCDQQWGLDHAAWAVLRHMLPAADVPTFEMSLDMTQSPAYHYALGQELAPLRQQGVWILGSGNLVHNLRLLNWANVEARPMDWAAEFDARAAEALQAGDHAALIDYPSLGRTAALAVPTSDHYLPLLYVIGAQAAGEATTFAHAGFQHGSISMRCVQIG